MLTVTVTLGVYHGVYDHGVNSLQNYNFRSEQVAVLHSAHARNRHKKQEK